MTSPLRSRERTAPRPPRRGAMVFLYALGILTVVLTIGINVQGVGVGSVQLHARGMYEDQANWAAVSGILYGRRHVRELWRQAYRASVANNPPGILGQPTAPTTPYPGQDSRNPNTERDWQGEAWTGIYWDSIRDNQTVFDPVFPRMEVLMGTLNHHYLANATPQAKARVWFTLGLNESLIRNGYFFGVLGGEGPYTPLFNSPDYAPDDVLYTLESLGRVDLPNRAAPLDALQGQVVATQRAILTFQLWTILETDDYDELLYRDLVFELEGR